jgi:glycosyltransferase involved in cell wall biosynthesis
MEGDFLVSIITPVYNGDKYLKTYFEQIEALTFKNIEIIIVNDGSTDKSSEIIIEYAKNDKRIRYINKLENAGVSQARNDAIDVASGKWLFFFDCDDTFDKNIISNCIDTVDNENDTVCYNYASVRKNGEIAVHEFSYDCSVYSKLDKYDLISHSLGTTISEMKDYIAGKRTMRAGK